MLTGAGAASPEIAKPAGSESLKPMPLNGIFPVFWIAIVSAEEEPGGIGFDRKNLLILAPGRLVNVASAGSTLMTPLVVVTAPAGIVFVRLPLTVMVTLSVKIQRPEAGRLPALNAKELSPGVPVSVPPHVPTLKLSGVARIIPAGILSLNAIPDSASVPGLSNSILMVEAEPPKTVNGLKPFTIAIDLLLAVATLRLALRSDVRVRFSLFVIFAGEIVLVCRPGVLLVT